MDHIKPLVDAIAMHERQYHSYGDYSATQLINPPRIVQLNKRYGDKVTTPIAGSIASFIGTGVHFYMEHMLKLSNVKEARYELERGVFDKIEDRLITGKFDILSDNRHIYDIKTCKTWKTIFDPEMVEWTEQQNIYAYLLRRRGVDIEKIFIIAVYLDWQESLALRNKAYPQEPVIQYRLPLWSEDEQELYLLERLEEHKDNESLSDEDLYVCTPEERWERFEPNVHKKYAVMKNEKAARALKVSTDMTDILAYCRKSKSLSSESFVEVRYAQRKRCEKYCSVNQFCDVYQDYCEKKKTNTLNTRITMEEIWEST